MILRPRRAASLSGQAAIPEDEISWLAETVMNLEVKVFALEAEITGLNFELEYCRQVIQELASAFGGGGIDDMRRDMEQMLWILEPKAYSGARDAKEVENFLFDMEQYFLATNVEDEARKVSTTTMYLTGDAKLWWRTKYSEIQANQVRLDTWALLREAIRMQFFPENIEYNARQALWKLEHTGSMQDYVKSFSVLMSEKDKLFTFMEGLKPWARLELQRQRVTDLGSAMTAAECLTDFASGTRKDRQTTRNPLQNKTGGAKSFRSNSNRGGGDRNPHAQTGSQSSSNRNKPQENRQGASYRDYPKKQLLNALATFTDKASPAKQVEPQASASGGNDPGEDEDNLGSISQWCNTLSHQVAAKKTVPPRVGKTAPDLTGSYLEDEAQSRNPQKNGLMFVDGMIHGKPIRAMVDTGATHNYFASAEVERLGLVLEKGVGRVKAINSAAQSIAGVAKSVLINVGPFEGKTNLSVVVMDDFKLIIGLDFLRDTCTAVLPHVDSLMMMGAKPCVIPTLAGRTGEKGCKWSEPSYLCTIHFDEIEKALGPIPSVIKKLLKEFENVMLDELPQKLQPKRAVDHEIELVHGTKPPARAPYRISQPELVELRKQLKDMLESGIIKPAKSPYGAPVLFQRRPTAPYACAATIGRSTKSL
ncbi:UNVERIFIED_CONTAM: hypothetical protein Slati_2388500 [Sesamum latifolium]|uniref:Retrotransposon gag domain-containing protein n=1 Tax=Sesamum latifolium TaxID=2727402 RepID=A0AAW2WCQ9_9LAMI